MLTNRVVVYKLLGMQYIISNYLFLGNIPDLSANCLQVLVPVLGKNAFMLSDTIMYCCN